MANREIQPPGGDLGVNTSGRAGLINFLSAKRLFGDGVGGGGGRGKDYKNEAKLFKFQQQVLDERERAQAAREEMLYGNKTGIDLGAEQVSQNQGREHYQEMLNMVKDAKAQGASGEQLQQLVTSFDLETPRGGRARGTFDIVGGPKPPTGPAPDGPGPFVSDDPPVNDDPGPKKKPAREKDMWNTDITRKDVEGKGGNKGKMDLVDTPLHYKQADIMREGWDDQLAAHQKELADAGEAPLDEDETKQLAQEQAYAMFPLQARQAGSLSQNKLEGNLPYIKGDKATQKTISKMHPDAQFSDAGSISFGKVGNDGGIDLGENGARPAPSGESGITPGNQFNA